MNAKDLENYICPNTVAIVALIESGELPDTQGSIVSLTRTDLDTLITLGKLPPRVIS
jgi:hypothetical protein